MSQTLGIAAGRRTARAPSRGAPGRDLRSRGFTVVELMLVIALMGVLASVALTKYLVYVEKARVAHAIAEIQGIAVSIDAMRSDNPNDLPDSLAEIGAGVMLDPWGHPYRYLKLYGELPRGMSAIDAGLPPVAAPGGDQAGGAGGGGSPGGGSGGGGAPAGGGGGGGGSGGGGHPGGGDPPAIALARKDRFLVPINTDYDLYSMGPDGESEPQLHNAVSRDDVIRARDGAYVGLAESF